MAGLARTVGKEAELAFQDGMGSKTATFSQL